MSTIASRKYPRIPLDIPGKLDMQFGPPRKLSWTTMDVSVRTASCEGVGLKLRVPSRGPILRNRRSVLHFYAGNSPIEIPGRIAWSAIDGDSSVDMGIHFNLALAQATSRELYSSWIVASIISLRDFVDGQV